MPMPEGLRRIYSGEFNYLSNRKLPDGSFEYYLSKHGESVAYRFRVRDLYGKNEEVLEHEIINNRMPDHVRQRMEEAKNRRPT